MHDTIIVGASAAGLATAASLRALGKEYRLFDKAPHVGAAWRGHYRRLHLHTTKGLSGLPGFPMPSDFPRYPSREQMIAYLEEYARKLELRPELSVGVKRIRRGTDGWQVETDTEQLTTRNVVIATATRASLTSRRGPVRSPSMGRCCTARATSVATGFAGSGCW